MRLRLAVVVAVVALTGGGCAAVPAPRPEPAAELAALTRYYEKASRPQRRAVRKPIRDQRAAALRELSRQAQAVLSESASWEQQEQVELAAAVGEFRQNATSLHQAAADSHLPAVRREYQRVIRSWQQLRALAQRERH